MHVWETLGQFWIIHPSAGIYKGFGRRVPVIQKRGWTPTSVFSVDVPEHEWNWFIPSRWGGFLNSGSRIAWINRHSLLRNGRQKPVENSKSPEDGRHLRRGGHPDRQPCCPNGVWASLEREKAPRPPGMDASYPAEVVSMHEKRWESQVDEVVQLLKSLSGGISKQWWSSF